MYLVDAKFQTLKALETSPPPTHLYTQEKVYFRRILVDNICTNRPLSLAGPQPKHGPCPDKDSRRDLAVYKLSGSEVAVEDIGDCLDPPQGNPSDLQGENLVLKGRYQHATGRQPQPSRTDLEKLLGDYVDLYQWEDQPPPGWTIPSHVLPFYIDDKTPS